MSPVIPYYLFDAYLKKKCANSSNQIMMGFLYNENKDESRVGLVITNRNVIFYIFIFALVRLDCWLAGK